MRRFGSSIVTLVLLATACRDSTRGPRIATVEILPSPANVQRNKSLQLQAVTLGATADTIRGRGVSWKVLDSTIATVSSTGELTGVGSGNTSVVAAAGGVADTALVIVSGFSESGTLSDNFSSYPNTAAFVSNTGQFGLYPIALNTNLAEIDQGVRYAGHQTLRMTQPAGASAGNLVLFVYLPEPVGNMWLRTKMRFSPGWRPSTIENGGFDALLHWGWAGSTAHRGELSVTPSARYDLLFFATGATGLASTDAGAAGDHFTDGQWIDVILHYQRLDDTRTRTRLWMAPDGQAPVLRATTEGTMSSGIAPVIDRVRLSPEYKWPLAAGQSVWLGQWEIVNGAQVASPFGLPAS